MAGHEPGELLPYRLHEDEPKADGDNRVDYRPNEADRGRGRSPARLSERVVPFNPGHREHISIGVHPENHHRKSLHAKEKPVMVLADD